jgi:hypothetical protein
MRDAKAIQKMKGNNIPLRQAHMNRRAVFILLMEIHSTLLCQNDTGIIGIHK